MRTYRLGRFGGGLDGLTMQEEMEQVPGPDQIIMRVHAASLNRRDTMILDGSYPLPSRDNVVPLSDGAGEIVAIGQAVTRFAVGDRVTGSYFARWIDGGLTPALIDQLGCTLDGMLSEYAVLDEQWAVRLPDHLDWREAASLSCAGLTAWSSLTGAGQILPGQWVLVIGTGGVALHALQFARLLGCRVAAVTSRGAKAGKLEELGADLVIDAGRTPEWGRAIREQTGGIDLVVETGGPATFAQSLAACGLHGRIVLLTVQDSRGGSVEIPGALYQRSLVRIDRVFVGNRTGLETMLRAIDAHKMKPVIDRSFPFAEVREAYRHFQRGDLFGKVTVDIA
jgi:NADPH:quinone reductase-like Zn-dependent oxidoreductase